MAKHKEDGYAVLMYPRSKRPYFAGGWVVSGARFATLVFISKQGALEYRKTENIMRISKTVPASVVLK